MKNLQWQIKGISVVSFHIKLFFVSNLEKKLALTICFYFNEMLACFRSSASHQGFWKSCFFFFFFQWSWFSCSVQIAQELLRWALGRSCCQLALHRLLRLYLMRGEIWPRSYHILLCPSLPLEGRQYCCTSLLRLRGHCGNAKWWYHWSLSYKISWAVLLCYSMPKAFN